MTITNYTDLQTEIASALHRSDLTSNIPLFIQLAESKINRDLRLREQEQLSYTDYLTTATSRYLDFPSGYVEFFNLKVKTKDAADSTYERLIFLPPERIEQEYGNGQVTHYTLRDQIEINTLPGEDKTIQMWYLKKWDIATDSTNWLLTNHPDAYFFGALANAAGWLKDDSRASLWVSAWEEALAGLNEQADRSRDMDTLDLSEGQYQSRRSTYNILTG